GGQPAAMVEVKVRDPDGVELGPGQPFLRHAVDGGGRAIKEQRGAAGREPVGGTASFLVRHGGTGAEYRELHSLTFPLRVPALSRGRSALVPPAAGTPNPLCINKKRDISGVPDEFFVKEGNS